MFPFLHGISLNPTGLSDRELQTLELKSFFTPSFQISRHVQKIPLVSSQKE